ncbi:hypothetical protein GLOIN_2v1764099 [Rhizophagus irregularis DAOM 181602=DAOM 197198]|uniref:Serine-threonine/tyrosine-protein kinase catalytic domain-containing protein n=1 Tax=Rhizophagus irregularis (strain DAOM 181602 / DAOM 197198 / MUCL 43194) TaxID=747089 RepID=A0A2P4QT93_RHIID|nr:hypothetical protein GLOIN_2v1764099 [Rhizophagus irregularis DAOM 181602=DAOM 197198]POG80859.1 hypothetical protein GLOIN_2v1764099 [Rhizophagus irregularis DAOM 181602=DAOM 197198]|eukprot:XP_025187725.1 hypothetical protein GLOIN_2v1764099 [Rhizophagus irregularis DAOM 181602=DAOM 197198]
MKENFPHRTSGNNDIDELICYTQLKLSKFRFIQLRWIWDDGAQEWTRAGPMNVALKLLDNSQNISKHITNLQSASLAGMFGITKDPTSSYMIVMKYYENGNLYQYLDHCNEIILGEIEIWSICYGVSLEVLKESIPRENSRKSSRRKLTCRTDEKVSTDARIADVGLHGLCDNDINNDAIQRYGVLPYVAPEVLRGENHSTSSPWNIFIWYCYEYSCNLKKTVDICDGKRLEIPEDTPRFYSELRQCRDDDPKKRPTVLYLNKN